jgi:uncharacterized protein YlxW (UPF0749 family)|tara:strand:+ start:3146 stop:3358 length:213 start_codon:yes stop_codon:yes gene_type:complete
MATIDLNTLTNQKLELQSDFNKLGANIKQVEVDLAQMKANLNALNGAMQQVNKLIEMAGGNPVEKNDKKV